MKPLRNEQKEDVMNGLILQTKLDELHEQLREVQRRRALLRILCFGAALMALLAWTGLPAGWSTLKVLGLIGSVLIGASFVVMIRARRMRWTALELARLIEEKHPELNALLLTAVEQLESNEDNLFKERLLQSAAEYGARNRWTKDVTEQALRRLNWQLGGAAVLGAVAVLFLLAGVRWQDKATIAEAPPAKAPADVAAVVTPGDTEVERGDRVIVEARFAKDVPADATIVVTELSGDERDRIPMRLTVDQQVFGGLIPKVDKDANYRVEFSGQQSETYHITTYLFPALVQADVRITPPMYAGLPVKEIKNTLKVSALEHSELAFSFKINKAVKAAELYGEDKTILPLTASAEDPTLLTGTLKVDKSQKWRLHLVDDKERANKNPPWITVTAQMNQLAKIEVVFPKRDLQVSSLQELPVEARVWDDVGVTKSGASFNIAGKMKEVIFKTAAGGPGEKKDVSAQLHLEEEKVNPKQLVSYYVWAEDKGPKGEVRRSMSDMFFADVRSFEDIFREAEPPPGEKSPQKGQAEELVDLQKQVVNATWKLIRDGQVTPDAKTPVGDVKVVQQSQDIALNQTKEAMEKAKDAQVKNALTEAWKSMKDALAPLAQAAAESKNSPLPQALTFEQSALEWLHQAQNLEHVVMRQNKASSGSGKQSNKEQLVNLELKQKEQRYEEAKKATAEQSAEQQENLQVLNRLKELARRQEALAEKMKELKNQMAKAKTAEERNELDNQLKHLQDEQEQLLRDLDDLKERMETPENSANMAQAKEQLEKTRDKVVDTAEKLQQKELADAANAATRAQRDLEKMQEDFKQKTAKRFSEDMKHMRAEARATAERQKQIGEALENQRTPQESQDTSAALQKMLTGSQVAQQIAEQSAKVKELLEDMRRISEQAEGNNPLLHRSLYESVREAQTGGLEENLTKARDESGRGRRAEAQDAEHKASLSVDALRKGVEKAAENVLGSEAEALKMAKAELDKLIQEAQKENAGPQFEMKEPAAASTPPDKSAEPDLAQKKTRDAPPPSELPAASQPPPGAVPEATESGKAGEKPKSPDSSGLTKSGGYRPGTEPGNPGKSKDMFPTYGPSPKAGKRDGGGLAQNKPMDGAAQPAGEGLKDPKDMPKNPAQAATAESAKSFPKPLSELPKPPNAASSPQSASAQTAQDTPSSGGDKPGQNMQAANNGGNETKESSQPPRSPAVSPSATTKGRGQASADGQTGSPKGAGSTASASSNPIRKDGPPGSPDGSGLGSNARKAGAMFFEEANEEENSAPISGTGYNGWSDRLRNVEEMLSVPELRNEAAKVLDQARTMRIDHERNNAPPQAEHLQLRIVQPLVELRDRVAEELAKRDTGNPSAPVDRDPVPPAFRELVRRYYTELGAGK